MSPQIFSDRIQILSEGLDYSTAKNRAISSNIANIETPGYKAFKVLMDEKKSAAGSVNPSVLTKTHPRHLAGSKSKLSGNMSIIRDKSTTMRQDGNNVDLEHELAELSANSIYFTAVSRFLSKNFAGLKSVISEGRR
ncbi:flagellar basal body rod protein FlgB [bacterium]|nr:flagellar basal body rod protein FlgB [bacterium]